MGRKLIPIILIGLLLIVISGNGIHRFNTIPDKNKKHEYQNLTGSYDHAGEVGDKKANLRHRFSEYPFSSSDEKIKIGLALSGGAAKGLAHIGVIKALEEAGIQINYVAGTSMGALIGAAYAAGIPIDSLEQIALSIGWKDVAMLYDPTVPTSGFVDGEGVEDFLISLFDTTKIENLPIPYAATAADISSGQLFVIDKGSLVAAVRTSISIPVIFKPRKYEDIYLVDGGLVDPVPIEVVRSMGADFIIAVNVLVPPGDSLNIDGIKYLNADLIYSDENESWFPIEWREEEYRKSHLNLFQISQRTVMISQSRIARFQVELEKPDILIEPDTRDIKAWDFHRGERAIKRGYIEALKVLNNYKGQESN